MDLLLLMITVCNFGKILTNDLKNNSIDLIFDKNTNFYNLINNYYSYYLF